MGSYKQRGEPSIDSENGVLEGFGSLSAEMNRTWVNRICILHIMIEVID